MGFRWSGVQIPPARPITTPISTNNFAATTASHQPAEAGGPSGFGPSNFSCPPESDRLTTESDCVPETAGDVFRRILKERTRRPSCPRRRTRGWQTQTILKFERTCSRPTSVRRCELHMVKSPRAIWIPFGVQLVPKWTQKTEGRSGLQYGSPCGSESTSISWQTLASTGQLRLKSLANSSKTRSSD